MYSAGPHKYSLLIKSRPLTLLYRDLLKLFQRNSVSQIVLQHAVLQLELVLLIYHFEDYQKNSLNMNFQKYLNWVRFLQGDFIPVISVVVYNIPYIIYGI